MSVIYLSKGIVRRGSTEDRLTIAHCGQEFLLTGTEAAIWQNGQFRFGDAKEGWALEHLHRMGLVEFEQEDSALSKYRILSRCICCPGKASGLQGPLIGAERHLFIWLTKAGLRLTLAELIFLTEHGIAPSEDLLYEDNRQALVETIYTRDTIEDNILENRMERAACRDTVTGHLLQLLKKKRLILL